MALAGLTQLKILLSVALSDVSQDGLLQQCLDGAEEAVRSFTKRPGLVSPPVTYDGVGSDPPPVYLDGPGVVTLLLPHYPVTTAPITVWEDVVGFGGQAPNAFSAPPLTQGVDYMLKPDDPTGVYASLSGVVQRLRSPNLGGPLGMNPLLPYGTLAGGPAGPFWMRAAGSIKVAFTAGYLAGGVPMDLTTAVVEVAAWVKRNGQFGGSEVLAGENLGQYHYQLAAAALGSAPPLGSVRQVLSKYRQRTL